jgi:hypothetical protein
MKSLLKIALTVFASVLLASAVQADVISEWNFETNTPPDVSDSATGPSSAADVGNGTASGEHASSSTDWTTPTGNGSANSFSSNNWTKGDYYQFSLDTTGFLNITLQWDQTLSATGPDTFDLAYSSNGGTSFTVGLNNYVIPVVAWDDTTPDAGSTFTLDLSAVTALNNNPNVVFRLRAEKDSTEGTNSVDNFIVNADVIPEPSTFALIAAGTGLLLGVQRLRRKRS